MLVSERISDEDLKEVAEDFGGYIKFVVDIEKGVITAGGTRHYEGENILLEKGSKQNNLWGGGLDLETNEVDYDSMINIRPNDNNPSREVLSQEIRDKMAKIVRKLLR
mgnify:CR=1 FL=1